MHTKREIPLSLLYVHTYMYIVCLCHHQKDELKGNTTHDPVFGSPELVSSQYRIQGGGV